MEKTDTYKTPAIMAGVLYVSGMYLNKVMLIEIQYGREELILFRSPNID